jgi:histidinol dehydrogenase
LSEKITNAGGIFMGEHSFEVLGDYVAGPSHVMPTGGSARFASPLNVWDFVHIISLIALNPVTTAEIAPLAARIARAEGLEGHARSADFRVKIATESRRHRVIKSLCPCYLWQKDLTNATCLPT